MKTCNKCYKKHGGNGRICAACLMQNYSSPYTADFRIMERFRQERAMRDWGHSVNAEMATETSMELRWAMEVA